jgi:hypothetical protein
MWGFLFFNFLLVVVFYLFEICYRVAHAAFLMRSRKIQEQLRGVDNPEKWIAGPHLDGYLYENAKREVPQDSQLLNFLRSCGVPEDRAVDDVNSIRSIRNESYLMLFQPRVSLIYLLAGVTNVLLFSMLLTPITNAFLLVGIILIIIWHLVTRQTRH